jgi:hypothetical protein
MSQARGVAPTQEAVPARKVQGVITAVKAEGVLKTVAVDTVTGSSTGGHSWTRRVAGSEKSFWAGESSRTVQEVTPRVTMSAAPETVAGAKGNFGGDATSTTERVAPISKTVPMAETANGPEKDAHVPATRGPKSVRSRQELSAFISTTVLPKTNRVYKKEWMTFKAFVKTETGSDDSFLTDCTDDEKASLIALMMMRRHEAGKRGKAATAKMMWATVFFDSSIIATARMSG